MQPKKYIGTFEGVKRDELQSHSELPVFTRNVKVAEDAELKRGMLLASENPRGEYHVATAADAGNSKSFYGIAAEDFIADSDHTITQAYVSGVFHEEKIITADTDTVAVSLFELELRRQNIHLKKLLDRFGHYDATQA